MQIHQKGNLPKRLRTTALVSHSFKFIFVGMEVLWLIKIWHFFFGPLLTLNIKTIFWVLFENACSVWHLAKDQTANIINKDRLFVIERDQSIAWLIYLRGSKSCYLPVVLLFLTNFVQARQWDCHNLWRHFIIYVKYI